jgi:tetratricopeptide (TPR) repeat protein
MRRWPAALLLLSFGCSSGTPERPRFVGGNLEPSEVVAEDVDLRRLAKTDDCTGCHADVGTHWQSSVHAYASFDNPWYRASVDEFRKERGRHESRFCAGCHDPLLLLSGGIDGDVEADDDLAYAGITCLVCHGTEGTRPLGNGSYALTAETVLVPDPASEDEIEEHRKQLTMSPLRTAKLCGSCHRSFSGPDMGNPNHLTGIDDFGDWASSAFGGAATWHLAAVEPRDCQSCHMPAESASDGEMAGSRDGTIRAHRWGASHTALAAQLGEPALFAQVKSALEGAVTVDVGAVRTGTRRALFPRETKARPSERLVFDVLLQNAKVGHRFPGGIRDLQDSWVEVVVTDSTGRTLATSVRTGESDDDVHSLRATVLDAGANPERLHRVHRFSTPAFDRTVDAHDARAVRYSMHLPRRLALPLRVDVRLLHRKHAPDFQRIACEASRTDRGIAFSEGAQARGKIAIDPCFTEPITTVGSATAWLGRGAHSKPRTGGAARPDVERLLTQGLALLHGKQEHLRLAKPSIDRALRLARKDGDPQTVARALVLQARLSSAEGRPELSMELTRQVESYIGPHPVLDRLRGDAHARVWRWENAAAFYRRVADASQRDPKAWRSLARAYGSLGRDRDALEASERGLALLPNDEGLLRSRALALRALRDPRASKAEAEWLAHRAPDTQAAQLSACEQSHEVCRRDRQPIPHYTLTPVTKRFHASLDPR